LRRAVLYGRGHSAELVFHALESNGTAILGICDDNLETMGGGFCGREVINPSQIGALCPDAVIITESEKTEEIYRNIAHLSDLGIQIICLDESWRIKPSQNGSANDLISSLSGSIKAEHPNASRTVRS
jgi:hypothetical protein